MAPSPLLDQARTGNAQAIVALINHNLAPKGFTVEGDRQFQRLTLHITGTTLPPQATMVEYLRSGIERLHIHGLDQLHLSGAAADDPTGGWRQVVALGAGAEDPPPLPTVDLGTPEPEAAPPSLSCLGWAYDLLELPHGSDGGTVEARYHKRRAKLLQRGDRAALEPLKVAYHKLKAALEAQARYLETAHPETAYPSPPSGSSSPLASPASPSPPSTEPDLTPLVQALQRRRLPNQVAIQGEQLQVRLPADRVPAPRKSMARVYTAVAEQPLAALGIDHLETLVVCGLDAHKKVVWKQTAPLPQQGLSEADTDLFSFENRQSNAVIFPALMVLGMLMNAFPLVNMLLLGVKIWLHEFGHATVAWLAGRQAIPLPLGWTNVGAQRSLFVYFGLLILFGLLYRAGHREQRRWPMILAGVLVLVQFWMTWMISTRTFEMLLYFGGIGGELYLCALLMVSFYFPMPDYFRWDFYRYPVVLGAAFTFWGQFWLWKQIARGKASIPFGAMWGDPNHGDMNRLVNEHGWTPADLMGTYNAIANICLMVILSLYLYFFLKQNRQWLFALSQRWLARS
jgi:hypothetical protein